MPIQITVSTPETQYQLAHPLPLKVTYTNQGHSAVTMREPERTWEVALVVSLPGSGTLEGQAAFGKLFYTNYQGVERRSIEDANDVTLAPGQSYSFSEDIGSRWPHLLGPGKRQLKVIDRTVEPALESNAVEVHLLIAPESVPPLLHLAEHSKGSNDPNAVSSEDTAALANREFAVKWLAEIHPGFTLRIPSPDAATEARNLAEVTRLREWWQRSQDDLELLNRIIELNRTGLSRSVAPPAP